ncbi:cytochrome b-c1 complex subunit 7 [Cyathus striatus]|nr:cytochrome b-c1 complex subunit 7 [Cyathus striatus]
MFGPLGPSLAPYIKPNGAVYKWLMPIANWYTNLSGYRKYGFKYDDLIMEENDTVQRALTRLTEREKYDRAFRFKRASQASVLHAPLPKEEWTKPEEVYFLSSPSRDVANAVLFKDDRYLKPHIVDIMREEAERKMWDTAVVKRK